MLAEMDDYKFRLGNVLKNNYDEIILSDALLDPIEESITVSSPMCSDCCFETYCGSDPVYHYAVHKDFLGRKPESDFCKRNMRIFNYLLKKYLTCNETKLIFHNWID